MPDQMPLNEFIEQVCDKGIIAARRDYVDDAYDSAKPRDKESYDGAEFGFKACLGKTPSELRDILGAAREDSRKRWIGVPDDSGYWFARCFEAEVEWVCNCVSAALMTTGHIPIVPPTARAVLLAAEILGVEEG